MKPAANEWRWSGEQCASSGCSGVQYASQGHPTVVGFWVAGRVGVYFVVSCMMWSAVRWWVPHPSFRCKPCLCLHPLHYSYRLSRGASTLESRSEA